MNRIYRYKGLQVEVKLEPIFAEAVGVALLPPRGFIAVVSIRREEAMPVLVAPMRLSGDAQRPFATRAEALMAGFSAGQRIIDDLLQPAD
ncbi:hypothetical protein [Paraburkholderia sp. MM5384-R2]|uniref:hypothetical protein n=1 Tax=Paraburkholderia sp. MM5384-R2 TaxID=2723097 RepID=UPI00161DB5E9|nr:hypothetical protein [Paraburkholderia sp. MM5384-R2]MBB5502044.1 hypothetical protein [Paraburkholderia sp. MM5384-R2]